MATYTSEDFAKVTPIETILRSPFLYLPEGVSPVRHLAGEMVSTAILLGVGHVSSHRCHEWWVIAATEDWVGDLSLFDELRHFPQGGRNAMRPEVLLKAFCDDLWVSDGGGATCLKGDPEPDEVLKDLIAIFSTTVARWVAFRIKEDETP